MTATDELLPCPFCGAEAELVHSRAGDDFVRCTDPSCHARTRNFHENDVGARDAWNERVDDAKLRELVRDALMPRLLYAVYKCPDEDMQIHDAVEWADSELHKRAKELGIRLEMEVDA